ncbi:DNA cytosine methyltransferase [Neobacillus cucumis]|nr:DNA cytosine methyltransferase [Neobacillus cucumis]
MKVVDFFCGAGGFSEGFRQAGFDVILAVDHWEPAVITHRENHPDCKTIKDDVIRIAYLDDDEFHSLVPDSEIIIGSPPCVAFSNSNKSGKGDKQLGLKLLTSYLRIIARKQMKKGSILKYWILENVPNLEKYIKEIYTASDLGLEGDFELKIPNANIYNSKEYGVAQNRKRFICGNYIHPEPTNNPNEVIPLKHILKCLGTPMAKNNSIVIDPNYEGLNMPSVELTDHHYLKEIAEFEWKKAKISKTDKGYMGKMPFPENVDNPSRTIMATLSYSSRESIIYKLENKKDRYRTPTIREVASIMSFPIDYKFYGNSMMTKYKLVGNAVTPKLSYSFAAEIAKAENLPIDNNYKRIKHLNEAKFYNLNVEGIMPINEEKPKNKNSKYKYHIPNLIEKAYRVELTNKNSNFEEDQFIWNTEIHKSNGKTAKVYDIEMDFTLFEEVQEGLFEKINYWFKGLQNNIVSFNKFQEIYCMTQNQRNQLVGPDELLVLIKHFLIENSISNIGIFISARQIIKDGEKIETIIEIPFNIYVGYCLLKVILEKMKIVDLSKNDDQQLSLLILK